MALSRHDRGTKPQTDTDATTELVRVAFGNVVNVRSLPTRGVTRIEIELPIESHVEATAQLFGKDVLVMRVSLPKGSAYGITDGAMPIANGRPLAGAAQQPPAQASSTDRTRTGRTQRHPMPVGLTGGPAVDIVRWLGARCAEAAFQDWLGVRNEAAAIERVRVLCEVESRAEIPKSSEARILFFEHIYTPYTANEPGAGEQAGCAAVGPSTRPAAEVREIRPATTGGSAP